MEAIDQDPEVVVIPDKLLARFPESGPLYGRHCVQFEKRVSNGPRVVRLHGDPTPGLTNRVIRSC